MKMILLAAASLLAATPAMAQDFTGPRIEARVGFDHLNLDSTNKHVDANGVTYGVEAGYDVQVLPHVIAGVDGGFQGSSADGSVRNAFRADSKHEWSLGGRVGYTMGNVLAYGKVGYANERLAINTRDLNRDGLRYGGGLELATSRHTYVKAEYVTSNYDDSIAAHQGVVGFGVRF